jgi:hypothetical protein
MTPAGGQRQEAWRRERVNRLLTYASHDGSHGQTDVLINRADGALPN